MLWELANYGEGEKSNGGNVFDRYDIAWCKVNKLKTSFYLLDMWSREIQMLLLGSNQSTKTKTLNFQTNVWKQLLDNIIIW